MLSCEFKNNSITISGDLKVQHLESLGDCLQRGVDATEAISIDLSRVTEIDTAGLQALLAFLLTRNGIGAVKIVDFSSAVDRALKLTGLDGQFRSFAG